MFVDNRMKKYYNRTYYVISNLIIRGGNELIADQLFDLNIYKPRLIKIISPNVKKYESGGGFTNILSIIPLDHSKSTITYIPSIKQYFKANSDYISNISVNLVDEDDRAVSFIAGPPTIVKIRCMEMDNVLSTFHVQISNVDSSNIYIENTPSSFKSKLPKVLDLRGKWSVGLARIYLPPKIMNITPPFNNIYIL